MSAITKKPSKQKAKQSHSPSAMAFHAQAEETHVVGIGNLRVILCHDDGFWFAQGLEIDYAADGKSQQEVKLNFEKGLEATIDQHLKVYGNIQQMLVPAPKEIWQELGASGKHMRYSQVTFHRDMVEENFSQLPYSGINYIERTEEIAA
jgi:hypothetical protein